MSYRLNQCSSYKTFLTVELSSNQAKYFGRRCGDFLDFTFCLDFNTTIAIPLVMDTMYACPKKKKKKKKKTTERSMFFVEIL